MITVKELSKDPLAVLEGHTTEEIVAFLEKANEHYYNTNTSLISDELFDWVKDYLRKKAPKHPFLKTVGAPVDNKVELPEWMGSLDKIRDDPKALTSWKSKYPAPYVLTDKLDGISGMFALYRTKQVELFTRGDGLYGQNVSSMLPYIERDCGNGNLEKMLESLPKKSKALLVRGEFIISKEGWEKIKHKGSNPRNMVAGLLNAKKPDLEVATHLRFVAYELVEPKMKFNEGLLYMKNLGFSVVSHRTMSADELNNDSITSYLVERRRESPFDIDGIVVRDNEAHNIIKGKNPKYAFAYKTILTHEEAEVLVYKVEWNVSKDGMLKPTVFFNPVIINGVKIQKATGFNGAYIQQHKIGPGSKIVIIRSGDVIPHILRVLTPSQNGEPSMPDSYEWTDTHVDIRIPESNDDNDQMRLKQMEHFVKTLDIKHVGEGILKKLYAVGVKDIPSLLSLQKKDLLLVEGIQEKGAEKIYQSIQHSFKNTNCESLMVASNLFGRGFGEKKIKAILQKNPAILEKKVIASLEPVEGIGKATEAKFMENLPKFYAFLESIQFECRKPAPVPVASASKSASASSKKAKTSPFAGMTVVFTGFRNKEWEKHIEEMGGKITGTVSKKTSLVVASDVNDDSSKVVKAKELEIPLYDKKAFAEKYGFGL